MSKTLTLIRQQEKREQAMPARVMSFTSGKGGVGKTHLVTNTAVALAERGRRVLILDADLGLANVDVLFGLQIQHTIHDYLEGRVSLSELLVEGPGGVDIIPASSGVDSLVQLSHRERHGLLLALEEVASSYDYLLIDTPAGIGPDVLSFNGASQEILCVVTPEPTSLTDAYALIKVLSRRFGERQIQVVVNNCPNERMAEQTFERFEGVVQQYLQVELGYLGWVSRDETVLDATRAQKPFVLEYPSAAVSRSVTRMADSIDAGFFGNRVKGGIQFFFQQLLEAGGNVSDGI
ncbi:MinD/ParA family protein [bacterium]|nr:MinD/ParA family protein [bacterium]